MGPNAALIAQLLITALQHATELNQLLATAQSEGRDVSDAERDAAGARATAALDALAAQRPPTP